MKLNIKQPKKKKNDLLKNLVTTATIGYAVYKALDSGNKQEPKKRKETKTLNKPQEKIPTWFWWFLAFIILAGIAEFSEWLHS